MDSETRGGAARAASELKGYHSFFMFGRAAVSRIGAPSAASDCRGVNVWPRLCAKAENAAPIPTPVVFRDRGARFFFFSNEGSPREPVHVHVRQGEAEAKFWLWPEVAVVDSYGFSRRALTLLARIVELRRNEIERAWNEHFS